MEQDELGGETVSRVADDREGDVMLPCCIVACVFLVLLKEDFRIHVSMPNHFLEHSSPLTLGGVPLFESQLADRLENFEKIYYKAWSPTRS